MSRISQCFKRLEQSRKKAVIPYITAGDPNLAVTVPLMHALVAGGADIIELGVPFSDPMADGPVIQQAVDRALSQGTTLKEVLSIVASFRKQDSVTPVILMGYLNPFEWMGYEALAESAKEVGVDGILVVDLPPEESEQWTSILSEQELDRIFLVAPNTSQQRLHTIAKYCSGYMYYVSLKGITGADLSVESVKQRVAEIKAVIELPLAVGFGIKNATTARVLAPHVDGVVVGSALVKLVAQFSSNKEELLNQVQSFVNTLRVAVDS